MVVHTSSRMASQNIARLPRWGCWAAAARAWGRDNSMTFELRMGNNPRVVEVEHRADRGYFYVPGRGSAELAVEGFGTVAEFAAEVRGRHRPAARGAVYGAPAQVILRHRPRGGGRIVNLSGSGVCQGFPGTHRDNVLRVTVHARATTVSMRWQIPQLHRLCAPGRKAGNVSELCQEPLRRPFSGVRTSARVGGGRGGCGPDRRP